MALCFGMRPKHGPFLLCFQVGSRGRSEKIRTYNYAQDRITDHRIPITVHNVDEFLQGEEKLDGVIQRLLQESRKEILLEVLQAAK